MRKQKGLLSELATLSAQLQQMDVSAHSNPTDFNRLQALFNASSQKIYMEISGKDSAELRPIKDILSMYERYSITLSGVKTSTDNANAGTAQAQLLATSQNENLQLRGQIAQMQGTQQLLAAQKASASAGGGGGGSAPALPQSTPTPSGGGNDAAVHQMQKMIEQGKAKTLQSSNEVKNSLTLIRAELTNITCTIGRTKERKDKIEGFLKQVEAQMQALN